MFDLTRRIVLNIEGLADEIMGTVNPLLVMEMVDKELFYETITESIDNYFYDLSTELDATKFLRGLEGEYPIDCQKEIVNRIDSKVYDFMELRLKNKDLKHSPPSSIYTTYSGETVWLIWRG